MYRIALLSLLSFAVAYPGDEEKFKRSADPGYVSDLGASGYGGGYAISSGIGGGALLSQLVEVQNNVAVPQAVGIPHPVPVGIPVGVPQPVPVDVPVEVPVVKTITVPYEKPVPVPIIRKVPVEVIRKVPYPVPQPVPVKVPIVKTRHLYYDVIKKVHHHHGW